MTTQDVGTKKVCHICLGDQFLASEVQEKGTPEPCNYCSEIRGAITLDELASRIHDALQEHFRLTPGYPSNLYEDFLYREGKWERRGDDVEIVVAEMACVDEKIAGDLTSLLSGRHSYEAAKEGEENPYGPEAMYEERKPFYLGLQITWDELRREIRSRSRFFSPGLEEMLADIFADLRSLKTYGNRPVILEISPDDHDSFFWRGRTALSSQEVEAILMSPVQELGSPPSQVAKAGRMNPQGISVFYGATDQSTCVSELRPPVGSSVVIGKFELLRSVRLLDLGALAEAYVATSFFDPECSVRKGRAAFLRHLVREITQPVMPNAEALEYLSTQVVAEYLAHLDDPRFGGMFYPSSQKGGSGKNVVLFYHACAVEPYDLPAGSSVEVRIPSASPLDHEEDFFDEIWVSETVPSNLAEEVPTTGNGIPTPPSLQGFIEYLLEEPEDDRKPTLRLDVESIVVQDINAVDYLSNERPVTRHRQSQGSPWCRNR